MRSKGQVSVSPNGRELIRGRRDVHVSHAKTSLYHPHHPLQQATPLWRRVPTRDAQGKPLSDFMMIFPAVDFQQKPQFDFIVDQIQQVFHYYQESIVFADLNVKLKLLWVSIYAIPGMCLEISTAINYRIPESRLVSHRV